MEIGSQKDLFNFCKVGDRPLNIPSNPQLKYKNHGWKGWADFLGKSEKI